MVLGMQPQVSCSLSNTLSLSYIPSIAHCIATRLVALMRTVGQLIILVHNSTGQTKEDMVARI